MLLNIIQANAFVSEASLHEEEEDFTVDEHEGVIPRIEIESQENKNNGNHPLGITYSYI